MPSPSWAVLVSPANAGSPTVSVLVAAPQGPSRVRVARRFCVPPGQHSTLRGRDLPTSQLGMSRASTTAVKHDGDVPPSANKASRKILCAAGSCRARDARHIASRKSARRASTSSTSTSRCPEWNRNRLIPRRRSSPSPCAPAVVLHPLGLTAFLSRRRGPTSAGRGRRCDAATRIGVVTEEIWKRSRLTTRSWACRAGSAAVRAGPLSRAGGVLVGIITRAEPLQSQVLPGHSGGPGAVRGHEVVQGLANCCQGHFGGARDFTFVILIVVGHRFR